MTAMLVVTLPNSRAAEKEADLIGIELAARAGYDPAAAATLWQKMDAASKTKMPQFLNTHPDSDNRQEKLAKLAPKMMQYYFPDAEHPVYPLH